MKKRWLGILVALFAGVAGGPALAQSIVPPEPAGSPGAPRQFTVEIIIFEYTDGYSGNELFVAESVEPPPLAVDAGEELVFSDIPELPPARPDHSKTQLDEIPLLRQLDMFVLEPDKLTMTDIYAKLEKLDAYRPLMHTAWTQSAVERELAPPVRLRRLGDAPLRLDGELTLYLSRFLHLVVNLQLDPSAAGSVPSYDPYAAADTAPSGRDGYPVSGKPDLRPAVIRFRINEDRIFRSGEMRYFDHPRFGVLAKVTRYEAANDERNPSGPMLSGAKPQ